MDEVKGARRETGALEGQEDEVDRGNARVKKEEGHICYQCNKSFYHAGNLKKQLECFYAVEDFVEFVRLLPNFHEGCRELSDIGVQLWLWRQKRWQKRASRKIKRRLRGLMPSSAALRPLCRPVVSWVAAQRMSGLPCLMACSHRVA